MTQELLKYFYYFCCLVTISVVSFLLQSEFNATTTLPAKRANLECDEEWPDLELFLPINVVDDESFRFYNEWFLPSFALFWPRKHAKLLIVGDEENVNASITDEIASRFALENADVRLKLSKPFPYPIAAKRAGWFKSQWVKFWAENLTDSEFIGIIDPDAMFVTRVTLEDLFFEGKKPIVYAAYGSPKEDIGFWSTVPDGTYTFTGLLEPFDCMTYFPVVIKTAHMKIMRDLITQHMNKTTFDEAVDEMIKADSMSEFSLMCTIMWHRLRDEYYWVVTDKGDRDFFQGQIGDRNEVEGMTDGAIFNRTRPHLAIHYKYQRKDHPVIDVLRTGVCYSMSDNEAKPPYCANVDRRALVNELEWQFEAYQFELEPGTLESHLLRLERMDKCPHEWNTTLLDSLRS